MSNLQISNIDLDRVAVTSEGMVNRDGAITTAGAESFDEGTILAIDSVSGEFVPWVDGGALNENGIAKAVLNLQMEIAGAGTYAIRPIVGGQVKLEMLTEHGTGKANVPNAVENLRDFAVFAVSVEELCKLDNQ